MNTNENFAFVSNCGEFSRVIVRYGEIVHIGCFKGTKSNAEAAIQSKYRREAMSEYLEKINLLFKSKLTDFQDIHADYDYALRWAAENGHIEVVKFLIEKGANIHANNNLALQYAAKYGHIDVVKFLVKKGANIHAKDNLALRWASENGHIDVVCYLSEISK